MIIGFWNRIWNSIQQEKTSSTDFDGMEEARLPAIWLLGKTGAGKSSIIRMITGNTKIEIGNGYEPCTQQVCMFNFPQDGPVVRFMDTKGIGDVGYDPAEDLASHSGASSIILAVARIDDPAQSELCNAVSAIRKSKSRFPIIVVHSRVDAVADQIKRDKNRNSNQKAIEKAAGRLLPGVDVSTVDHLIIDESRDGMFSLLEAELPLAAFQTRKKEWSTEERKQFAQIRTIIAKYSFLAGTTGSIPIAGLATVPAIQGRMLIEIANHYEVALTRDIFLKLAATLGMTVAARYGANLLGRQTATLIPGYGQTAGAVLAGAGAFATTFAIGRASGYFFYKMKEGKPPDRKEVRRLYKWALRNGRSS